MKGLADLGCGVLIIFGMVLVGYDVKDSFGPELLRATLTYNHLWQWGLAALAAGTFCAALGSIGEQLGTLVWRPTPTPPPVPEKPA